jgi:hypothetical protein
MRKTLAVAALAVMTVVAGVAGLPSPASAQGHGGNHGGGFHGGGIHSGSFREGGFRRGFGGGPAFFGGVGFVDPLAGPFYPYGYDYSYYPYYAAPVATAPAIDPSACASFQTSVPINGSPAAVTALACRQPDGSVQVVPQ